MEYRKCCRCKEQKPTSYFDKHHRDGFQGYCKQCKAIYRQGHYRQNKEKVTRYHIDRHNRLREEFNKFKSGKPCVDCGISYNPWVMDFDHVRGEKAHDIAALCTRSPKRLLIEIEKCELVCANCHRERTHRRKEAVRKDRRKVIDSLKE